MNIQEAINIFNLSGEITPESTRSVFRKLCSKYHPDKNPAGLEMMKVINAAYDALRDYTGTQSASNSNLSEEISDAIEAVIHLDGITIEICGSWVWLSGDTYTHKTAIKEAGFKFASKKKMWYFGEHSSSRGSMPIEAIHERYGRQAIPTISRALIA
jgi:hypothetical protein